MALILNGNSEHVVHVFRKKGLSEEKKVIFVTALDLMKCLEQIK